MKKIIPFLLTLCVIVTLTACNQDSQDATDTTSDDSILNILSDSDGYYSDTFGTGGITEVNIDISEEDWENLCANAIDEEYYSADITVNGTTVTNVGFRAKGASSLLAVSNSDSDRYGFKINFDEYIDDQTLNGLDMLVLNGSYADPSYMREYLAYAANAYLGAITPYVSYTRLSINGEYFGLYLSIESYKDSFVERVTDGDDDAVLYEAESESCTLLTNDDGSGFEPEVGDDDGNTNILNLIEILNSTTADNTDELESILDVDSVLKAMAINLVTGNYDSYSGSKAHNYYLLYSNGKFQYIGWDYNMAFGGFVEDSGSSITVDIDSPFYSTDSSSRPLMEKLLEIDEYKDIYLAYVYDLCDYFGDFDEKISTLATLIQDDVESDPTAFYTFAEFQNNLLASEIDYTQSTAKSTPSINNSDSTGLPADTSNQMTPPGRDSGEAPDLTEGEIPSLAEDETPDLPEGDVPALAEGEAPSFAEGEAPDLPEGDVPALAEGEAPAFAEGETPSFAEGEAPDLPEGDVPALAEGEAPAFAEGGVGSGNINANQQFPGGAMAGNSVTIDTISIFDYIQQRLETILNS